MGAGGPAPRPWGLQFRRRETIWPDCGGTATTAPARGTHRRSCGAAERPDVGGHVGGRATEVDVVLRQPDRRADHVRALGVEAGERRATLEEVEVRDVPPAGVLIVEGHAEVLRDEDLVVAEEPQDPLGRDVPVAARRGASHPHEQLDHAAVEVSERAALVPAGDERTEVADGVISLGARPHDHPSRRRRDGSDRRRKTSDTSPRGETRRAGDERCRGRRRRSH